MALAYWPKPKKEWRTPEPPYPMSNRTRFVRRLCSECGDAWLRIYYEHGSWWAEDENTLISRDIDFKREHDWEEGALCDGCAASRWFSYDD